MRTVAAQTLTQLADGDAHAAERLLPIVYDELKRLASGMIGAQPNGHSLQPTALVHEAYLKLIRHNDGDYNDRAHFMAVAAIAMRQVLVDHARSKSRLRRGGDAERVTMDLAGIPAQQSDVDVLAMHDALDRLAEMDPRKAKIIELRFFGGLSIDETADVLGVARSTVTQDWRFARAWIVRELGGAPGD